jgi:rhodanese-related sulfurtransferase
MWPVKTSGDSSIVQQLSVLEARERLSGDEVQLVDVREPFEFQYCRIEGAVHVPLRKILSGNVPELAPEKDVICYCHHGVRSQQAAQFLLRKGFRQVFNLRGGIHAWSLHVDPAVPTY